MNLLASSFSTDYSQRSLDGSGPNPLQTSLMKVSIDTTSPPDIVPSSSSSLENFKAYLTPMSTLTLEQILYKENINVWYFLVYFGMIWSYPPTTSRVCV